MPCVLTSLTDPKRVSAFSVCSALHFLIGLVVAPPSYCRGGNARPPVPLTTQGLCLRRVYLTQLARDVPFLQCFRRPFNGGIESIYNVIIDMLKSKPLILLFSICFILCVPLPLLFSWIEYIFIFCLICFIGLFDVPPFCHCGVASGLLCPPSGGAAPHRTSQYHPPPFLASTLLPL